MTWINQQDGSFRREQPDRRHNMGHLDSSYRELYAVKHQTMQIQTPQHAAGYVIQTAAPGAVDQTGCSQRGRSGQIDPFELLEDPCVWNFP